MKRNAAIAIDGRRNAKDSLSISRSNSCSSPYVQVCDSQAPDPLPQPQPAHRSSDREGPTVRAKSTDIPEPEANERRHRRATTQQAPSLTSQRASQLPPRETSSQSLCVGASSASSSSAAAAAACAHFGLSPSRSAGQEEAKVTRSRSIRQSTSRSPSPFLTPSASNQNLCSSALVMNQSHSASPSGASSDVSSRESLNSSSAGGGYESPHVSQSQSPHASTNSGFGGGRMGRSSPGTEMGTAGTCFFPQQTRRAPAPLILCPEPSDETSPPTSPLQLHKKPSRRGKHIPSQIDPLPQQHSLDRCPEPKGRASEHRQSEVGSSSSLNSTDRSVAKRHSCGSENGAEEDSQLLKVDQNGYLPGGRHPKLNSRSASIRAEPDWRGAHCADAEARRRSEIRRESLDAKVSSSSPISFPLSQSIHSFCIILYECENFRKHDSSAQVDRSI